MSNNATLVSIVPFPIIEYKPGIYPGHFELAGAKNSIPECLTIGESIYYVEIDENRTIQVKTLATDLAKSIVRDYLISNLEYNMEEDAAPGFFWLEGEQTSTSVMSKFSEQLNEAKRQQHNWFKRLVTLADDDWEKTRQHKTISDMQRYAAKSLKLERPWLIEIKSESGMVNCPACRTVISNEAIVCPSCRCVINMDKYKTFQFAEK